MNLKKLAVMGTIIASVLTTTANALDVTLKRSNTIVMNKEFTPESAAQVAIEAAVMDMLLPSNEPIYLVLNTPGGSIFAGLEMIENLNSLSRPINTITIYAASMGFQTVQQLKGKRYIVGNGTLMSHKARGSVEGEFPGQLDERYRYVLGVVTDMDKINADRTKGVHTTESYQKLIENEYWCGPADCAKNGFIDDKVIVKCDESLYGTHDEIVQEDVVFGMQLQFSARFSNCPTITAPLAVSATVDGSDLSKVLHKLTRDQKETILNIKKRTQEYLTSKTKKVIYY
jgi:ATP-dependent protease ClpP protease subunit